MADRRWFTLELAEELFEKAETAAEAGDLTVTQLLECLLSQAFERGAAQVGAEMGRTRARRGLPAGWAPIEFAFGSD